ncbi:MAG: ADP-dependent glucokinase/phosphofructokinase [Methanosarcinaceae archaeon]|nr:ADP-dependent glucokinase/phosphofructokinase [Methanosarcinaceae archaeon]
MNILCGYNVNIDSVYRISGAEFTELLDEIAGNKITGNEEEEEEEEELGKEEGESGKGKKKGVRSTASLTRAEILDKIENPPGIINSLSDFAAGLAYCMKNGLGAEWLVQEPLVFDFLKGRYLEKSLVRMGGNAGIMANVLSELGAFQVIPNIAVPSKSQLSLFSKKAIYFPGMAGKKPCSSDSPAMLARQNKDPIHFVFDFTDGDIFSLFGEEIRIPRENRFIATFDELNLRLFINPAFEAYALQHIRKMDGALISGFHILLENYPEGTTYPDRIEKALSELRAWKTRNKKLAIHVELGHFSSRRMARDVFLKFAEVADSLGMNEEELAMLYSLHGLPPEAIIKRDAETLAKAALALASEHGLSRLLIHTREFGLSVFRENSGQKAPEFEALEFGIRAAAAFAASGKLKGRDFVEKTTASLPRSNFGKARVGEFLKAFEGAPYREGAFAHSGGYTLCLLPTLLCENPVSTVGLGDTFTASFFLRGLELRVQA